MQFRNTLWLVTPNTAGFTASLVFGLEQNFISLLLVCTRELQVLLDGHQLSPYKAHLHKWATNIAYAFFYNFSWRANIQTGL